MARNDLLHCGPIRSDAARLSFVVFLPIPKPVKIAANDMMVIGLVNVRKSVEI